MGRPQVGTARLGAKFGLDIDALFKENTLEEGVLVPQHQTFVGGGAVGRLEVVEVGLMDANGLLELLDVLSAALSESGLGLSVSLFALLRSSVDLQRLYRG